jgi:hypothetical protein
MIARVLDARTTTSCVAIRARDPTFSRLLIFLRAPGLCHVAIDCAFHKGFGGWFALDLLV